MAEPVQYETLRLLNLAPEGPVLGVVLANNPSPMTLAGTNTWLLWGDRSRRAAVVVDPGPDDERHLNAVAQAAGIVELILLTHSHLDHSAGAGSLSELTGAPVAAVAREFQLGGPALADGATIRAAGVSLQVLTTPGHTSDSVCFVGSDGDFVLTGDTILGQGSSIIAHPDGVLADYLASLDRLAALCTTSSVDHSGHCSGHRAITGLPGHGPELPDLGATVAGYRTHRLHRLTQLREMLAANPNSTVSDVIDQVYATVEPRLRLAAERTVRAQLAYLQQSER